MKRTKRQETSIIIYFSFYLLLSVGLLSYYVFGLVPKVSEIETLKDSTNQTYNKHENIVQKGLGFEEFTVLSKSSDLNTYSKELVQSLDSKFYTKYFENSTGDNYKTFIENQSKKITQGQNYEDFLDKSQEISKILPIYTEVNMGDSSEYLSDFEFTHYIESILKTFNLEYSDEIGVSELVLVEEFSNDQNKSKLDTNIFYVPVNLQLEGVKSDILNFLYFIEHVGNTTILSDEINIEHQDDDKFLYRGTSQSSGQKIILDGANTFSRTQYNIFQNQFIDFESIEFNNFIDEERTRVSQSQDLIKRIKDDQANDKYAVDVTLRFYVKGVQNLKIINQLSDYVTYYQKTKQLFTQLKKSDSTSESIKPILDEVIQIHGELEKELKDINQSIAKQEELLQTLKDVSEYTELLNKLHSKIGYNYYITNVLNQIKTHQNNKNLETSNTQLSTYLKEVEKTISGLMKTEKETQQQYENRLNNRNIFITVLQIEKKINTLQ